MRKISVIIPCYNVTNYIDRCLQSLERQTIGMENLEIILVDDASTDDTLNKLRDWEERYPENILVITYEENIRQGGARNIGMQYATADYIGFVDADDWVEATMYEELLKPLEEQTYDVVLGKFQYDDASGRKVGAEESKREDQKYEFESLNGYYIRKMDHLGNCGEFGVVPAGIYRRNLILENQLWFPERIAYEDNYWEAVLQLYVKNLYIVDRVFYHYCVNEGSTVNQRNALHQLDRLAVELEIQEVYRAKRMFEAYRDELERRFIKYYYLNTMFILLTRFDDVDEDLYEEMKGNVNRYFPDFYKNENLGELNAREQSLLKLVRIPRKITREEWERFRLAYLNTFDG